MVLVGLVMAVAPAGAGAQTAASLYQVDVPVADQSPGARQQAARDGLAIVLSRLTGVARMPDDPRVRRALGNPDPYYLQFSYHPGAAPGQLMVRLQFSPPALFQLIRETGLPIWPSNRPAVLVWALVDQDGELRIPPAGSGDPVERAMLARALERGLVVKLATLVDPVGDPVEEVPAAPSAAALPGAAEPPDTEPAVEQPDQRAPESEAETGELEPQPRAPEDVVLRPALPDGTPVWPTVGYWNAGLPELRALSQRDAGDVRVIARLHGTTGGAWAGEVEIHDPSAEPLAGAEPVAGAEPPAGTGPTVDAGATADVPSPTQAMLVPAGPVILDAAAPDIESLAAALVDRIVEYLLGRYQVEAGDSSVVTVSVSGIDSARDYAQVLRIFSGVEVVSDVGVVGAAGDRVRFALTTNAAIEQLRALVTSDGRLVVEARAQAPLATEAGTADGAPSAVVAVSPTPNPAPTGATAPGTGAPGTMAAPEDPFATVGGPGLGLELRWQGS